LDGQKLQTTFWWRNVLEVGAYDTDKITLRWFLRKKYVKMGTKWDWLRIASFDVLDRYIS
jgi:hypothetical protein